MTRFSVIESVRHLIEQYRSFIKSSYRLPDPALHLGEADRGIIMFRKLLRDQIEAVQNGGDPIGTNRDPAKDEVIHLIQDGLSAFSFAAAQANRK